MFFLNAHCGGIVCQIHRKGDQTFLGRHETSGVGHDVRRPEWIREKIINGYLCQFYPSPFHVDIFCTRSIYFYNGTFIFVKIMIISLSLTIMSLCLRQWDSCEMSMAYSAYLLMFSHDRHRCSTESLRLFSFSCDSPISSLWQISGLESREFGGWGGGRILSVEGVTGTLPGLPSRFSTFPWCQRWFLLWELLFFLHQIWFVTDIHWMNWVVSIQ